MEMEQMMECLLAKIHARMDTNIKTVQEKMFTTQERMESQISSLVSTMEADR
jgi:molybdopterin-biosynthesis enzyme MoeA-like protein